MKLVLYTHDFYKGGIDTFLFNLLNNKNINDQFNIELYTSLVHPSYNKYINTFKSNIKIKRFFLVDISEIIFFLNRKFKTSIFSKILIIIKYPLIFINTLVLFFWFILKKPNIFFFVSGGLPGPDINLSFLFAKALLKPIYNFKYIFNFHNFSANPQSKIKKIYLKFIFMITYFLSDKLVTVSNSVILDTKKIYNLNSCDKLCFIHNGSKQIIPLKKDNSNQLKTKFDINTNYCVFTILGTLDKRKGHRFLLEIYKNLLNTKKNSHLLICGDGSKEERDELFDMINNLGIKKENISFLGYVDDVESLFLMTDILLIGSQFGESFGFPAVEAMQRKIPFVSTNFGGLDEVITEGEGGYKTHYKYQKDFLEKIIKLTNLNSDELYVLKDKGYKRYLMNFTDDIMSKKYRFMFLE